MNFNVSTYVLASEYHVAYVYVTMANSPRPGVWVIERSVDGGSSFKPWMYFADSKEECVRQFGEESIQPLTRDDQVICETKYSKLIPLEDGEIIILLLKNRPGGDNFTSSEALQEFTRATNIRLRFIRPLTFGINNLLNFEKTFLSRYFYSIREIKVGARCVCNGHAEACDFIDPNSPDKSHCACRHNTTGVQCEKCKPPFMQKRWRPATPNDPFECEKCNCNGHSEECIFDDEGGGRCIKCDHNTKGINCHECKFGFYRRKGLPLNATNICVKCSCFKSSQTGGCDAETGLCQCKNNFTNAPACDKCAYGYYKEPDCPRCPCYRNGTLDDICAPSRGQCICKKSYSGADCSSCAASYWGFPKCQPCNCDLSGSVSPNCDSTNGKCTCKKQFSGNLCSSCSVGFFGFPECQACDCNPLGTFEDVCNLTNGTCKCKPGFGGSRCDQCIPGYYGFPDCKPCTCYSEGSINENCSKDGKCSCHPRYGGLKCNQCAPGYFDFPKCEACGCDPAGSSGTSCLNGACWCKDNFEGTKCNKCKKNYYNYPTCESCSCNPAGIVSNFSRCSEIPSQKFCNCKERVVGRNCDTCAPHFKNLRAINPLGCDPCRCNRAGSINGLDYCDGDSGQCICKESVTGLTCDRCSYGTYALSSGNYLGCVPCDCDVGGSWRSVCDKITGACQCKFRIEGRRCDRPQIAHYFYTTYQYLYELEDGRGEYHSIRYDYNETVFPGFSWKGYAKFSEIQKKVTIDFFIIRSSFYRVIFHYHNPGTEPIVGNLTLTNENEPPQYLKVTFAPTLKPKKYLVPMDKATPFHLFVTRRPWSASLTADEPLLVDYIVFLPQAYFEATILRENVTGACTVSTPTYQLCRHYGYTKFPPSSISYPKGFANANVDIPADARDSFLINAVSLSDQEREHVFDLDVDKESKYVLILSYVYRVTNPPPKGQIARLTVEVNTLNKIKMNIPFQVPICQNTFPCRHVIVDNKGAPVKFHLANGPSTVIVKLDNEIGEATFSILGLIFLPIRDWHIDHVKPSLICIMRNLECLDLPFDEMSESMKIPFNGQSTSSVSSNIIDESMGMIQLSGVAPVTQNYILVVHYYQPDYPEFGIEITFLKSMQSATEQATLKISHCPNKNGCRSMIQFKKPLGVLEAGKEFMLIMNLPKDRFANFENLLLISEKNFSPTQLKLPIVDRSTEFFAQCAQDAFYVDDSSSEFCKQAVFTLTTDHNSGGAFCGCNATGSYGYTCKPLGGQCNCKPNIIGRECKACRSGYYGFPDCKPCNCPKTVDYCDSVTGECVCPKNVVGNNCDRCAPLAYGYDSKMGCDECNCHPLGVLDGNLKCDSRTGQCRCKAKYDGRICSLCKIGYFDFPDCRRCNCHYDGTTSDVCDSKSGSCYCKENVLRPNCDVCKQGTFNLDPKNPEGCTKCFCFGVAKNCRSSELKLTPVKAINYSNWSAVEIEFSESELSFTPIVTTSKLTETQFRLEPVPMGQVYLLSKSDSRKNFYFKVPNEFLGNRLTSYGGFIRYQTVELPLKGSVINSIDTPVTPDLIFIGRNHSIELTNDEQPASPFSTQKFEIELVESKFRHLYESTPVTREQFMTLLTDLQSIYIRASYFTPVGAVYLADFTFDLASNGSILNASLARRVEQCSCPVNYKGSSCEECASGYYRISVGPYLGSCIPCKCHGHSNECDPLTGKCLNCNHNTTGDHCELCKSGFYGNATVGKPDDCLSCPCPSCNCKPGYTGKLCNLCAVGYFGNPLIPGNFCQPCNCNGNIDSTDPDSCHSFSGNCAKCLNNTAGKSCERCADGYYGDAIKLKNCRPCQCVNCGTAVCDQYSGNCKCHPNVIGDYCNECKPNHYGFNTCAGCTPCNCSDASKGHDCDADSGQCRCQPGATGRTCNVCEPGFWKYSKLGCESCGCSEKYSKGVVCNQKTGKCECLPGVVGEKCDKCPRRWVFVDQKGCHQCTDCQDTLLDDTDLLMNEITPIFNDLSNTAKSVYTAKKFSLLISNLTKLENKMSININASKLINLSTLGNEMVKIIKGSDNLSVWQERLSHLASSVVKWNKTLSKADTILHESKKVSNEVNKTIEQFKATEHLYKTEAAEVSFPAMLSQCESNTNEVKRVNSFIDGKTREVDDILNELAFNFWSKVKRLFKDISALKTDANGFKERLNRAVNILTDANLKIANSTSVSLDVQRSLNISHTSLKEPMISNINLMKNLDSSIATHLKEAKAKINQSSAILIATSSSLVTLVELSYPVTTKKERLVGLLGKLKKLQELRLTNEVKKAIQYSNNLNKTAINLGLTFSRVFEEESLARKIKAAKAFGIVEKAIESAENLVRDLNISSDKPWKKIKDEISSVQQDVMKNKGKASELKANILTIGAKDLYQKNETINLKDAMIKLQSQKLDKLIIELGNTTENIIAFNKDSKLMESIQLSAHIANNVSTRFDQLVIDIDSISNATNELKQDQEQIFIDINEGTSLYTLYDPRKIRERVHNSEVKVAEMMNLVKSSKPVIEKLKRMVIRARKMASHIDLAMKLDKISFAQLRLPENLLRTSKSLTSLSLNFASIYNDGLLFFMGNLNKSQPQHVKRSTDKDLTNRNDYIAVCLNKGKVKVVLDLGSGPQSIETDDTFNDGDWTGLVFNRVGKKMNLTMLKGDKMTVTVGYIEGSSFLFDLNNQSQIFVGLIPSDYIVPDTINANIFNGSLAHITYSDIPISLHNFKRGFYSGGAFSPDPPKFKGCFKDELDNSKRTPGVTLGCVESRVTEAVFKTNVRPSFIEMPLKKEIESFQISFKFKTNLSKTIIFAMHMTPGENTNMAFSSIFIEKGILKFVTFPGGSAYSDVRCNDSEWHYVMLTKKGNSYKLNIDDKPEVSKDFPEQNLHESAESYSIGGSDEHIRGNFPVFIGCVGEIVVNNELQDLRNADDVNAATLVNCDQQLINSDNDTSTEIIPNLPSLTNTNITPTTPAINPSLLANYTTVPNCALPMVPIEPGVTIDSHGRRFGTSRHSRVEIKLSSELIKSFETGSNISLRFSPTRKMFGEGNRAGILFFVSDAQFDEFMCLYIYDQVMYLAWNVGSGHKILKGDWIISKSNVRITFGLNGNAGWVDSYTATSPGNSTKFNIVSPAYIGGLPPIAAHRVGPLIWNMNHSYIGCIRDIVINGIPISLEEKETENGYKFVNTPICTNQIESGVYLTGQNSYLSCYDKFKVGLTVVIEFHIKPRILNGLILATFGHPNEKGEISDYLIAKLNNGAIQLTVNNGFGEKTATLDMKNGSAAICDGNWHMITITKISNSHMITVNKEESEAVFGPGGFNVADTSTPIFVGDVPDYYRRILPDLPPPYIGCVSHMSAYSPKQRGYINYISMGRYCDYIGNAMEYCPIF
uniref:Laminin subunit alpha n=1 Tax=Tetranychus urticae TaxID=32264 RepID=T1KF65_TETUR